MPRESTFDILRNPFVVLAIAPSATLDEIFDAYEEKLSDGRSAQRDLQSAQEILRNPMQRLNAELSGFLDMEWVQCREIVESIKADKQPGELAAKVDRFGPLAKANILTHIFERTQAGPAELSALLVAQSLVDAEAVHDAINRMRRVAGVPAADRDPVGKQLQVLFDRQSKAVLNCLPDATLRAGVVTALVEAILPDANRALVERLDAFLAAYALATEPESARRFDRIASAAENVKRLPNEPALLIEVLSALSAWDEINQPLQLIENFKARDDLRSKKAYELVRDLALWLANSKSDYPTAQKLLEGCAEIFKELPRASEIIQEDLDVIARNILANSLESLREFTEQVEKN